MAITIVGTNQGGVKTDGTNVTLTFSTGANAPQPGDHIYVFGGYVAGGSNYGPNTANGTYEQLLLSTSGTNTFGLWRLVVGASPPTVVVCQGDANAAHGIAYGSMVIRGADTLFDALNITTGSSTNPAPGAVTTVCNGDQVLLFAGSSVNDASFGDPANYVTGAVHANANSTNDTTIALNFRTPTIAAGTETPAAYSTWASGSWVCFTVALTVAFTKRVVLSGSTWAVPADWSTINRIVAIGAGGNGAAQAGGGNSGGGGGAFCQIGNVTSTNIQPLDSLSIQIATAGQQVVTWLKNRAGTPAIILQADYGRVGVVNPGVTPAAGGVGGAIANNIPASTGFAGAAGGTFNASGNASSAGGGGSAGPLGVGKSSTNLGGSSAGSGGGGSNGGSSTVGLTGSGGNLGGQGSSGTGAGAASGGAATAGKGGGGGGGALGGAGNGGLGAVNTSFDGTTGPGGGGGGGGEGSTTGGSGGTYGGGGGGAGTTGGTGGQGLIVAMYQPAFNTVGATIQQTPAQLPEISSLRTWLSTTAGWLPPAAPAVNYIPGSVYDWGTIADVREPRTWIAINPALLTPIVATPRNQYDWVLPKVAEQPVRTWISFQQPGLIPKVPVKQTDWPLPKVAEQPIRFWSQAPQITPPVVVDTTLPCVVVDWGLEFITPFTAADTQRNTALLAPTVAPPTFMPGLVFDWGIPAEPQRDISLLTWTSQAIELNFVFRAPAFAFKPQPISFSPWTPQLNTSLLGTPAVTLPRNQYSWPLPQQIQQPIFTWAWSQPLELIPTRPTKVTDWPLPQPQPRPAITWTQSQPLELIPTVPTKVTDWQLPKVAEQPIRSWTFGPQPQLLPRNQYDWELPAQQPRSAITWIQSQPLGLIPTIPTRQTDWPLPKVAEQPIRFWSQSPQTTPPPPPTVPANQYDWPLPKVAEQPIRFWSQAPQITPTVQPPKNQYDWPLPKVAEQPVRFWSHSQQPQLLPCNQYSWPLTRATEETTRTWIASQSLGLIPTAPANQYDWPLPQPQPRPAITWTWAQPITLIPKVPVKVTDWQLPILRVPETLTWQLPNIALQVTPAAAMPKNQYAWPLPQRDNYPDLLRIWANTPGPGMFPPPPPVVPVTEVFPFIANMGTLMQRS